MSILIRPAAGHEDTQGSFSLQSVKDKTRKLKNAVVRNIALPQRLAPASTTSKGVVTGVSGLGLLGAASSVVGGTAGLAAPVVIAGAAVGLSTVSRQNNAKQFVQNDCAQVMLDHPKGRKEWNAREKSNCQTPYEQNVASYIVNAKKGSEYNVSNDQLASEKNKISSFYTQYCSDPTYKEYTLFCKNAKVKRYAKSNPPYVEVPQTQGYPQQVVPK